MKNGTFFPWCFFGGGVGSWGTIETVLASDQVKRAVATRKARAQNPKRRPDVGGTGKHTRHERSVEENVREDGTMEAHVIRKPLFMYAPPHAPPVAFAVSCTCADNPRTYAVCTRKIVPTGIVALQRGDKRERNRTLVYPHKPLEKAGVKSSPDHREGMPTGHVVCTAKQGKGLNTPIPTSTIRKQPVGSVVAGTPAAQSSNRK